MKKRVGGFAVVLWFAAAHLTHLERNLHTGQRRCSGRLRVSVDDNGGRWMWEGEEDVGSPGAGPNYE